MMTTMMVMMAIEAIKLFCRRRRCGCVACAIIAAAIIHMRRHSIKCAKHEMFIMLLGCCCHRRIQAQINDFIEIAIPVAGTIVVTVEPKNGRNCK